MIAHISPQKLVGQIAVVGSKSFAHRAMIAAALFSQNPVEILGMTSCDDVLATADCLCALGGKFQNNTIFPIENLPQTAVLDCRESGTTLRFLLPIVAALGLETQFVCAPSLAARPNGPLLELLQQHGITVDGLHLKGKLQNGRYEIDAGISSQYVTGLLFALSLLQGESTLVLKGKSVSKQYVQITLQVLENFGVKIAETADGYKIFGRAGTHKAVSPHSFAVEGDWSNASYFLVAGALGGNVTLHNLNIDSVQGDKKVLSVLKDCGAKVVQNGSFLNVSQGELQAFNVCAEDIPDVVPTLSVLAAFCHGTSQICGVERLRLKESDRLAGVLEMLKTANISAEFSNGVLKIEGGVPCGGRFVAHNDHRMAMSQTILALYANGQSCVDGAQCVAKSYPKFFEDINKLGDNCVSLER